MKNVGSKYKLSSVVAAIVLALISVAAFMTIAPKRGAAYADGGELKVHFVNVGQGDCCLIELPDGKKMIIDGAENKSEHENQIQTYIDNNLSGLKYFDYAILTHPDSDHCGSLDYVLEKYPSRVCYRPNVEAVGSAKKPYTDPGKPDLSENAKTKDTLAYADAIKAMYATTEDFTTKVYVTDPSVASQTITGGEGDDRYAFNFYSPLSSNYSDWNDYSPIMVLEYRGFKFTLTGDAEKKNEAEFAEKIAAAPADGVDDKYDVFDADFCVNVFKAGHHGSKTSSSQGLLDIMTTEDGAKSAYYIFSCDPDGNTYGHPNREVLDRLSAMGVPDENMLRTDILGDISFTVKFDGEKYSLFYGATKTAAVAGCPLKIDPFEAPTDAPPTDEPKQDDPTKTFLEKYWLYILIAVIVIIVIIAVVIYINRRNGKKNNGRSKGRRR